MRIRDIENILFSAQPEKDSKKARRTERDHRTAALSAGARRTTPRTPVRQFNRGR
ncbi:hypothetical protein BTM25_09450 [Actinomadura rubteroloni]|uniref:Uncharacterized protein n=1 Tax=Actinomadura rubteroloni TaxID=1926885 RepID=A0A2P4UNB9_9ACTN|nr:hypothetical protein [Actinomadura rubteroloni]POM26544.1 hypothetical protein BTM25_09450 [Actinomadura rubteroloni]